MTMRGMTQKLITALLELVLISASAPVLEASAALTRCDCPSMQMHDQSLDRQAAPAKQKTAPCNEMPNCLCGALCGTAVALPLQSLAAVAAVSSKKFSWPDFVEASGHSIKPAIPPPIAKI